ncbi:conserved hypothetical protein [Acidimicrobium ferrooxidans DSM 10331]|uniref:DUF2256 and DUF3253 domain-containing protein n=1 Tax=Acidimicrobium ferrooxidans (strain DSM 10331 / JCM 15462 / NBRC 103882 / ICP) TaxID=525909 RepID=C7M2C3_ACIFD|nr:conserved hypothetical protein [Acidimicrobium ferrooxidans DSM 10331]
MARSRRSPTKGAVPAKVCATCGRVMTWRRRWERTWDEVRYCSDACRRAKSRAIDVALEGAICDLLVGRRPGGSICPSEAARAVGGDRWRELVEPARAAARRLATRNVVEITQHGRPVDPATARGPIRIRLSTQQAPPPEA